MNINPIIESALSGLFHNSKAVNIAPLVLDTAKKGECYCTYYTYLDQDEYFADDEPVGGNTYGTVDVFCKGNYKSLIKEIKQRLQHVGFRVKIGPEQYEQDTKFYHVSINVNIENTEV
ncbi:MAG: hypothetical protein E7L17_13115 [Clostridium sp.]|uniref:hypothetical protein n=1 Tax=Clostridium sp. TaxID=1506 RepID=UPI00290A78C7|nr:hypothetical protein [Clostridium sp.]MDU7339042.1 hypothetical protein [Clostridium sp.]